MFRPSSISSGGSLWRGWHLGRVRRRSYEIFKKSFTLVSASLQASAADYGGGGTKTVSMFSKLMNQGSSFVMEGVKNLVVKKHNLPVTKIVEELMEVRLADCFEASRSGIQCQFPFFLQIRPGQHQDEFRYFDPKILRSDHNIPRAKNPFQV